MRREQGKLSKVINWVDCVTVKTHEECALERAYIECDANDSDGRICNGRTHTHTYTRKTKEARVFYFRVAFTHINLYAPKRMMNL